MKKFSAEIVSEKDGPFRRLAAALPVSGFIAGAGYKKACFGCEHQGKNLSCPPFSPSFAQYVGAAEQAGVIAIGRESGSPGDDPLALFAEARERLLRELLAWRQKGHLVAGAGACSACATCVAREGSVACRSPEKMVYSLESLGVNVAALTKSCFGFDLEWPGAGRPVEVIWAIGAVFFRAREYWGACGVFP